MSVLANEVNYTRPAELAPQTRCLSLTAIPQQGSGAFSSGQITFPLVQYGYIVPDSLVVSAIISYTADGGLGITGILGSCPASAWVHRLDTQINSQTIETINNYNTLYNMIVNAKMDVASKHGLSKPFGLTFSTSETNATYSPNFTNGDAHVQATGAGVKTVKGSFPLGCIYSSASKFLPLSMGDHRITLTIDDLNNFTFSSDTTGNGAVRTALSISQIQLSYDVIVFDEQTDALIMSQADGAGDIYLKSQSFAVSSSPLANGFVGQTEIPYAQSLTSIKSLHTLFTPLTGNRGFASYDATSQNGSIQYTVAGRPYPETAIDTLNRPQYATLEFLASIYGTKDPILACRTSMSNATWKVADANVATDSKVVSVPKAYFGANVEKLSSNSYLLSGISSMNSNLTLRVVNNTALAVALNAVFIVCYDAVIKYNPMMKQVGNWINMNLRTVHSKSIKLRLLLDYQDKVNRV